MSESSLYKDMLFEHYRHPRNRSEGALRDVDVVRRGANPRCGDEIEVGLRAHEGRLQQVKFRGRGCSVCIASTSMMTEAVNGLSVPQARQLCSDIRDWFSGSDGAALAEPPAGLDALSAVREYPARKRCVLLSWEALADALDAI